MNETVSISMSGSLPTVVRVRVVTRVLAHPPPVADADDAGGEHAGEPVVRGAGGEDRAVRGLVREERDLREDDAERAGDEQLEPAVAQQDEPGDRAAEREHEDGPDDAVEPGRPPQEAHVADDVRHLAVGARQVGEVAGLGVRGANGACSGFENCGGRDETPTRSAASGEAVRSQRRVPIARPRLAPLYAAQGMLAA